jgi:hypothetical protein
MHHENKKPRPQATTSPLQKEGQRCCAARKMRSAANARSHHSSLFCIKSGGKCSESALPYPSRSAIVRFAECAATPCLMISSAFAEKERLLEIAPSRRGAAGSQKGAAPIRGKTDGRSSSDQNCIICNSYYARGKGPRANLLFAGPRL